MIAATLVLAAVLGPGPGSGARLEATLSPSEITVGDRVRARIVLTLPEGTAPLTEPALDLGGRWGEAEVLQKSTVDSPQSTAGEATQRVWEVEITAFRTGELELPPLTAMVPAKPAFEVGMEEPLTLTVRSVLPATGEVEPRPPAAPSPWPGISPWWWLLAPLAALALLALLLWWRRRRKGPATGLLGSPLPPLGRLERELEVILHLDDPEAIHTRVSLAMRRYLEDALGFPAAEHTTSEIRRDLRSTRLSEELRRQILELLRRCDEVKFARARAPLEEARKRARMARQAAREVDAALHPVPTPQEDAA